MISLRRIFLEHNLPVNYIDERSILISVKINLRSSLTYSIYSQYIPNTIQVSSCLAHFFDRTVNK